MKNSNNIFTLILFLYVVFSSDAQGKKDRGEAIFLKHADKALAAIEAEAEVLSITGVAMVAYIPGDMTKSWVSKMKVVGNMTSKTSNLLAVASSKAAEMADTFQNSGSGVREPLKGEFGYIGGVIEEVAGGHILAVFSGAKGEQDVAVSKKGLAFLKEKFK